jgi:hypothetical protein
MAPEVLDLTLENIKKSINWEKADIFSLGIVILECLN